MKSNRNILLLITITVIFLMLLFVINQNEHEEQIGPTAVPQNSSMIKGEPASNSTVFVSREVCEGCHMSEKPFIPQAMSVKPHVNGGAYCLTCHRITHESHPIDSNVTCEKCHGTTPAKPAFINGSITCNNCHDYPDPLIPSNGNLITIHRPRGITCNNCHTDQCIKCHPDGGAGQIWEKRLTHLRTIMKTS